MLTWPPKDPGEVLDYQVDWSNQLVTGETISTSTFTLLSGDVVIQSSSHATTNTTVWLTGGTLNTKSVINNVITTSGGRTYEDSIALRIREK